jgi:hypothetical protein
MRFAQTTFPFDLKFMSFLLNRFSEIRNLVIRHSVNAAKCSAVILLSASAIPCHAQVSATASSPDNPYNLTFQTSLGTVHFHPDGQNDHQKLLNLEWNYKNNLLVGAAEFQNSFNQPTQFIYWGAKFRPLDSVPEMYFKLVAGLIHGYKGADADKIPFNEYGTAPAIVPAVGYCYKQFCSELIVFGTAGAMVTAGVRF